MNKREFKNKVYGELARVTRALSNPHRAEIIDLLAQGPYSVEQIAAQAGLSVANTSQHLQVLRAAELVEATRAGTYLYYRLANQGVFKVWKAVRDLGFERIGSVERTVRDFRASRPAVTSVTIDELVRKAKGGKITILDVRPEPEYRHGHIARAVSIPYDQLSRRVAELPRRREIVAYCRGPFCVFADDAVALLTKAGYRAARLEQGFPDWALMGLPTASAELH